ncbi:hypothetical protein HYW94_03425 [Candidatus Uhrbacteria bacterium]|nr:hypothetical protein [Candidatus Uhrbacteria bacterium]
MFQYIVLIGTAVGFIGTYAYIRETIRGKTKPNKVTWLMWSVAPLIATVAAVSDGVRLAVLPVFVSGFGPLLIFVASFVNPKSYWKLETFDYICGTCSILALVFWGVTKDPLVAIIFAIASDGFAAMPTLIKCWKYPETETVEAYMAGLFAVLTTFFALKKFDAIELAFPIYLVFANSLLITAVYIGRSRVLRISK